jgi:hypothetical protein
MGNEDIEKNFEEQIGNLWNGKEDDIEKAKLELYNHFTDIQNNQGTRLLGFVAGLFVLLQLTQTSKVYFLATVYDSFPTIKVLGDASLFWLWDVLKVAFLFAGTWAVLFFVMRTILRYSVFGQLTSNAIWVTKDDAKNFVRAYAEEKKMKPMDFEYRKAWVLAETTAEKVYHETIYWKLPAKWFLTFELPTRKCPHCEKRGYYFIGTVSIVLTILIILFLW